MLLTFEEYKEKYGWDEFTYPGEKITRQSTPKKFSNEEFDKFLNDLNTFRKEGYKDFEFSLVTDDTFTYDKHHTEKGTLHVDRSRDFNYKGYDTYNKKALVITATKVVKTKVSEDELKNRYQEYVEDYKKTRIENLIVMDTDIKRLKEQLEILTQNYTELKNEKV